MDIRRLAILGVLAAAAAGVLATPAAPRSQQTRLAANEAAVIADLRDIVAATQAYKASNDAFPGSLSCLGAPTVCPTGSFPPGTPPFLDPLRGAVAGTFGNVNVNNFWNRGYQFAYHPGAVVTYGQNDRGVETFTLAAIPRVVGASGQRFIADHTGTICESTPAAFPSNGVRVPPGCTKV